MLWNNAAFFLKSGPIAGLRRVKVENSTLTGVMKLAASSVRSVTSTWKSEYRATDVRGLNDKSRCRRDLDVDIKSRRTAIVFFVHVTYLLMA